MKWILKLGLGIYILTVLMLSGFSEASMTRNMNSQFSKQDSSKSSLNSDHKMIKISGELEEYKQQLYLETVSGEIYIISPQSYGQLEDILLPMTVNVHGFLKTAFQQSWGPSQGTQTLYIVSYKEVLPPN